MAGKRMGEQTVGAFTNVRVISRASVAGRKEEEGPLGGAFDRVLEDELDGEKSFEACQLLVASCNARISGELSEITFPIPSSRSSTGFPK